MPVELVKRERERWHVKEPSGRVREVRLDKLKAVAPSGEAEWMAAHHDMLAAAAREHAELLERQALMEARVAVADILKELRGEGSLQAKRAVLAAAQRVLGR